ncbi:hypothetical protein CEUSTIGMA_g7424.t1 [Chlamydomonas eustigma]|uniref:RING-type domain-containing protein n=1 Tax=Chlamydomonas eustigma TaxID=1157962 RepID=A0A250XA53_9CHLO|nr:hypothetical protein CEUSTIGMA_g7424.t1 [Chlamydomonas eustigma]|eukprot:GAX79985.1 hypothetical protein CEUSTIGMA_g7424.t1 [Chlamydomonas eustigma]
MNETMSYPPPSVPPSPATAFHAPSFFGTASLPTGAIGAVAVACVLLSVVSLLYMKRWTLNHAHNRHHREHELTSGPTPGTAGVSVRGSSQPRQIEDAGVPSYVKDLFPTRTVVSASEFKEGKLGGLRVLSKVQPAENLVVRSESLRSKRMSAVLAVLASSPKKSGRNLLVDLQVPLKKSKSHLCDATGSKSHLCDATGSKSHICDATGSKSHLCDATGDISKTSPSKTTAVGGPLTKSFNDCNLATATATKVLMRGGDRVSKSQKCSPSPSFSASGTESLSTGLAENRLVDGPGTNDSIVQVFPRPSIGEEHANTAVCDDHSSPLPTMRQQRTDFQLDTSYMALLAARDASCSIAALERGLAQGDRLSGRSSVPVRTHPSVPQVADAHDEVADTEAQEQEDEGDNAAAPQSFQLCLDEEGNQQQCPICLCEFEVGDVLQQLPCGHEFHQPCVDSWMDRHRTCPLCRHVLWSHLSGVTTNEGVPSHGQNNFRIEDV